MCLVLYLPYSFHSWMPNIPFTRHSLKPGLDTGLWTLDSGLWTLDSGLWTLDSGLWTLDSGLWTLDSGLWTLDSGLWTLDSGLWTLDSGFWILDSELYFIYVLYRKCEGIGGGGAGARGVLQYSTPFFLFIM